MNKLFEEWATQALTAWDVERRFRLLAAEGDVEAALRILGRLDAKTRGRKAGPKSAGQAIRPSRTSPRLPLSDRGRLCSARRLAGIATSQAPAPARRWP